MFSHMAIRDKELVSVHQETRSKVGIFSMTLLSMAALGISPSLALIMAAFPKAGASEVQMLTSIPNLMAIFASLVVAKLANVFPRKAIALAGPVFVLAGGVLPLAFHESLPFLLVCSAILGVGVGFISNITQVLINDLVAPERRQAAMAQNTIFVNAGAIVLTAAGGALSVSGWVNNYLVYVIALPVLLLVALLIPMDRAIEADVPEAPSGAEESPKGGLSKTVLAVAASILLFNCFYSIFTNNIGTIIIAGGIGDSALVGTIISVSMVGGLVCGLVLGKIVHLFQKYSLAVAFALYAISMAAIVLVPSVAVCYVASFVIGCAMTIVFAQCPFLISLCCTPLTMPMGMAAYSVGSSIGGFVSPVVTNALAGGLLSGTATDCFVVGAVASVLVFVVLAVTRFQAKLIDRAFGTRAAE